MAFWDCKQLTNVELPDVETIGRYTFYNCPNLQRIAIPLKDSMFPIHPYEQRYTQFEFCENLTRADLVGGESTKPSPLCSWRAGEIMK